MKPGDHVIWLQSHLCKHIVCQIKELENGWWIGATWCNVTWARVEKFSGFWAVVTPGFADAENIDYLYEPTEEEVFYSQLLALEGKYLIVPPELLRGRKICE